MKFRFIIALLFLCSGAYLFGQESYSPVDSLSVPPVFKIGEYEEQYPLLYETYDEILLSVCGDDMYVAFDRWMDMLHQMESYADQINFDLKGLKVWLKVFWDTSGRIDYLAYHLKPNSRNFEDLDIKAFFKSFTNYYQMAVESNSRFSHHGSAQFPTTLIPGVARSKN